MHFPIISTHQLQEVVCLLAGGDALLREVARRGRHVVENGRALARHALHQ